MKVLEEYYGPERLDSSRWDTRGASYRNQYEAYLRVEVNGKQLHVKRLVDADRYGPPYSWVMRDLRHQIMREVEKEVFGS